MTRMFILLFLFLPFVFCSKFELNSQKWTFTNGNLSGKAQLPGDIYSDLYKNKLIQNPYYADNDIRLRWVPRSDWTYQAKLKVPENLLNSKCLFLEFNGIDGVADVYLDGNLLGQTNNQFRVYTFNVTSKIKQSSLLELKFPPIVKHANRLFKKYKYEHGVEIPPSCPAEVQNGECHVNFLRKTQSSFSWDWGPSFPTIGFYKSVNLVHFDAFHLQQISPLVIYKDKVFSIQLQVLYQCSNLQANDYNFMVSISDLNLSLRLQPLVSCVQGETKKYEYQFKVENQDLELWYPHNYGNPKLYKLKVIANYRVGDTWQKESLYKSVGFRYVELNQSVIDNKNESLGRNFAFSVNSIPIFLKGVNYIPNSVFPSNFPLSRLEFLFYSLTQANMNTIRVWGGGNWPDDEFFDLADKYGVLVFHDLMFACALYPTDDNFLSNIEQEITEQVTRIRSHPSILIYSGNNELEVGIQDGWWFALNYTKPYMIQDYAKLMKTAIKAVKQADSSALIIRASPSNGDLERDIDEKPNDPAFGDVHFYNEFNNLWKPENLIIPRCATEFGVPSFPLRSTMLNYIPEKEWHYSSRLINLRNHHQFGVATLPLMISMHFSIPKINGSIDMDSFSYLTQLHQAIALRTQSEHYRRYRSYLNQTLGHTMCALYWQLNDVWAAPTWSSIDFDQRWKAAHYHAKKMFQPLLVSMFIDTSQTLQLYVVSDLVNKIDNVTLRLRMMSLTDKFSPIFEQNYSISVPPLASSKVDILDLTLYPYEQDFFFKAELFNSNEQQISDGFLPLDKLYKEATFGKAQLKSLKQLNSSNVYEIEIQATDVVPYIWLDLNLTRLAEKGMKNKDLLYHFSDNAFYITEPRTIINLTLYNNSNVTLTVSDLILCWVYNC